MSKAQKRRRLESAVARRAAHRADTGHRLLAPRLVLLFCAGCLLFGTPALWPKGSIGMTRIGGVPLLYVVLFAAWAVFIGVLGWLAESAIRRSAPDVERATLHSSDDVGDLLQ